MKAKFKRFCRKTIAIVLGLFLGWIVADVCFDQVPMTAYASDTAGAPPHAPLAEQDDTMHSIEALKPEAGTPWFGKLVLFAVLMFVAAAVLGPVAQSLKSPEPPERDEHHGHDAHGHDAHGKDAHAHAAPAHH